MSKLSALTVLAILCGCGANHPLSTTDGGGGATGMAGAGGGSGGANATGGSGAAGGSSGGSPGFGGFGGNLGGLLDGGLGGLLDSGLIGTCPASPVGQTCGGAGNPLVCISGTSDAGRPSGCVCALGRWLCPGMGGGDLGDGGPGMITTTPCPDNPAGMSCPGFGAICMRAGGGLCGCLGLQGGPLTWRCTM
jgi:hypothetical protein